MPVIYSDITILFTLPGNYSQIVQGPPVNPVYGSWWYTQEGTGGTSQVVWKFFDGSSWITKRTLTQDS